MYYNLYDAKHWVTNLLRENIVSVDFIKKDGTYRSMRCTLLSEKINENIFPDNKNVLNLFHGVNPHVTVWDLDENGWRTFNMDTVRKFVVHVQ